jgi:hypothetical protein
MLLTLGAMVIVYRVLSRDIMRLQVQRWDDEKQFKNIKHRITKIEFRLIRLETQVGLENGFKPPWPNGPILPEEFQWEEQYGLNPFKS